MSKNRCLVLTHTDPRVDNRILKQMFSINQMNALEILCLGIENLEHESIPIDAHKFNIINLRQIKFLKLFPKLIRNVINFFRMFFFMFIHSIKFKPDIIHCHDTYVLPVGTLFKIIFNSKLIYDAHELESNKNSQSKLFSKITFFIEFICWNRIDHLISVSKSIVNWYSENLGYISNTVILNAPQIQEQKESSSNIKLRDKLKISKDELLFVYVGLFCSGRGIDFLLDSFSKLDSNYNIVFIGFGEMEGKIKSYSSMNNNIYIHDAVPHDELVSFIKDADAGFCLIENVSLSDYFSLPNKLFEYMTAEIPIIASKLPEIELVLSKYKLGLVCDDNFTSLEKAIQNVVLSKANYEEAFKDLSWSAQKKKLEHLYSKYI